MLFELVVDFLGPLAFENHGGKANGPIPCGEIGDRGMTGQRENVVPFLNPVGMVRKNLAHEDARISIVDTDRDFHFLE